LLSISISRVSAQQTESQQEKRQTEKLRVLSTIKPIHAIVLAIAGEQVESAQLIPDFASPHNYSFKPSDISHIQQADVIFRIDENFEILLNHAFENKSPTTPLIALADDDNIHLLDRIGKHQHSAPAVEHQPNSAHHNHDSEDKKDLHIWTSPENLHILAGHIATTLSQLDANNKGLYESNLAHFKNRLLTVTKTIQAELQPIKKQPYIVFQNSWQYFSKQFGLQKPTIVDFHESISAGIKSIKTIRQKIQDTNIHCVLADPNTKAQRLTTLTESLSVNTGIIDILSTELALNKNTIFAMLQKMGHEIVHCLR